MFEIAEAEDTETDARVDSLDWNTAQEDDGEGTIILSFSFFRPLSLSYLLIKLAEENYDTDYEADHSDNEADHSDSDS